MNKKKNYAKLEKRVASLEVSVQTKSRKFIPEDSKGVYKNSTHCECPKSENKKETAQEITVLKQPIQVFCPECHSVHKLVKICPHCNNGYDDAANYCGYCGTELIVVRAVSQHS